MLTMLEKSSELLLLTQDQSLKVGFTSSTLNGFL